MVLKNIIVEDIIKLGFFVFFHKKKYCSIIIWMEEKSIWVDK